jgi:hypothetical protein
MIVRYPSASLSGGNKPYPGIDDVVVEEPEYMIYDYHSINQLRKLDQSKVYFAEGYAADKEYKRVLSKNYDYLSKVFRNTNVLSTASQPTTSNLAPTS